MTLKSRWTFPTCTTSRSATEPPVTLHVGHDLLNKGICVQLLRVNHMAVHDAVLREGGTDGGGVNSATEPPVTGNITLP